MPARTADFADKLQWLALERPGSIHLLHEMVETVIARYRGRPASPRASPVPAMTVEMTASAEYRAVRVYDPAVLLINPAEMLNRKAHDIMPGDLMDKFDRAIFTARRNKRSATYCYQHENGTNWRRRIVCPSEDLIVATLTPVG